MIDKNVFNISDKADQTSTELGALQSGGHSMGSIGSVSAGFEKWFVKKISSPVTTECMPNLINNGLLIFLTYIQQKCLVASFLVYLPWWAHLFSFVISQQCFKYQTIRKLGSLSWKYSFGVIFYLSNGIWI